MTTTASTTSRVPALPHRTPAAFAVSIPIGRTSQLCRNLLNCTWRRASRRQERADGAPLRPPAGHRRHTHGEYSRCRRSGDVKSFCVRRIHLGPRCRKFLERECPRSACQSDTAFVLPAAAAHSPPRSPRAATAGRRPHAPPNREPSTSSSGSVTDTFSPPQNHHTAVWRSAGTLRPTLPRQPPRASRSCAAHPDAFGCSPVGPACA